MSTGGGPRIMAAGSEFYDDDFDQNPFDGDSDEEYFTVAATQPAASPRTDRGCTWGMLPDEITEEETLFGGGRSRYVENDHQTWTSGFGAFGRGEPDSDNDSSPEDPIPDRELKKFLKTFGLKYEYSLLREGGFDLRKLLGMEKDDLIVAGFGGADKLPVLRRFLCAIRESHTFEWIHHEALSMTDKFVHTARKLANPMVPRFQASENSTEVAEGPTNLGDLKEQVERNMGSLYRQIITARPLLSYISAACSYLKAFSLTSATEESALEEDLQETLVNVDEIAAATEGLRMRLLALRSAMIAKPMLDETAL